MNDDFLKKVALLQLKEKVMKDSGDVLTDLADMQALRQFSAELKELIDEQHAAGAIPANPLAALRERLMKVVNSIKQLEIWQDERLKQFAPFRVRNYVGNRAQALHITKASLEQINTMISVLPPLTKEEHERIEEVISSCDSNDWEVKENTIQLHPELEAVQQALLPEFSKYCDGNKGRTLKEALGANLMGELQKLAELHAQQAAAAAEIESLLQQGNYKTAQAKGREARLFCFEGKSQVGFTDIDFAKQAEGINMCDKLVKNLKRHLISSNSSSNVMCEVIAHDLNRAETMLKDAQGEFREDLSAAAGSLKAKITKAKKEKKTMMIMIASGVIVILLLVAFSVYSERKKAAEQEAEKKAIAEQRAAEEEALAEQLAADEKALREGDLSVVENVAKHALPSSELAAKPLHEGWVKSEHSGGKLSELYQYSNGEKNGFSVAWHSNGEKKWVGKYANDNRDASYTAWHENGKTRLKGTYKAGQWHGLTEEWYVNGNKKIESNYKDGKQDGITTLWDENGEKKSEANYMDGKWHGLMTEWHENGKKRYETNYVGGKEQGLRTTWDEKGKKRYETNYVGGKKQGLRTTWDEDGQKYYETNFKDGDRHGLYTEWHESGKKYYETNYVDGMEKGLRTTWDENGEKSEATYRYGVEVKSLMLSR